MAFTKGQAYRYKRISPERYMLAHIKSRAKKEGIEFDIGAEDLLPFPTHCPVLGIPIKVNHGRGRSYDGSPSLDRVDPKRGYVRGNVKVISTKANWLKSNATIEEVRAILRYMEKCRVGDQLILFVSN